MGAEWSWQMATNSVFLFVAHIANMLFEAVAIAKRHIYNGFAYRRRMNNRWRCIVRETKSESRSHVRNCLRSEKMLCVCVFERGRASERASERERKREYDRISEIVHGIVNCGNVYFKQI